MSLAVVRSRALDGLNAPSVQVEVQLANGLPSFTLVGLADTAVKESRERVRAALQASGFEFPHNRRITVNLAPAELPKVGFANRVSSSQTECQVRGKARWEPSKQSVKRSRIGNCVVDLIRLWPVLQLAPPTRIQVRRDSRLDPTL